ncbi:MAG: CvpA family protein [Bacteroidales bacterium]|nr:CvpA family protein [Bacteroidales bacterium]
MSVNVLDLVFGVIIVVVAIMGAFKGFVRQVVGLLSIFAGVWCAFKFSSWAAVKVQQWCHAGERTMYIACFIIIVVLVILLGWLLARFIEKILKITTLGWLNRLLGAILGAAKIILLLSVIVYAFNRINTNWNLVSNATLKESSIWVWLVDLYEKVFPYLLKIKF